MSRMLSSPALRDALWGFGLLCAVLSLLSCPEESLEAARGGVTLCLNVIIPSLFPFFVLSALVVDLGLSRYFGRALQWMMRPLFHVSGTCASALALGLIGGYPVGARTAISLYEKGLCSKTEAERMLAFCNNSGPAFILGVVGVGVFSSSRAGIFLYLAHAAASLCVGFLFRFYKARSPALPASSASAPPPALRFSAAFTDAVKSAFSGTLNICAFVLFFTVFIRLLCVSGVLPVFSRLLSALLSPFGFSRPAAEHLLTGFVEMTSGVWALSGGGRLAGRLSMAAFMLGWAGLSVHCQVLSFLGSSGLSIRPYMTGKLLHGVFSALLVHLFSGLFSPDVPAGAYLAGQADTIAAASFGTTLTVSLAAAWVLWLLFLLISARGVQKNDGKTGRPAV